MLGFVAARPVAVRSLLRDAPRSLWALSREHPDGWGIANREASDWTVNRGTTCAQACPHYGELADAIQATVLVAHVRQKTVGTTSLANTHPFRQGSLVFAHNGTVNSLGPLVAGISSARLAEIAGDTDSERLFGFVATRVDDAADVERGIVAAVRDLHALGNIGSTSFLLSCGDRIYAHRLGRSLSIVIRHAEHEPRRTPAVIVASERLTDEPWNELAERSLHVLENPSGTPRVRTLVG